MEFYTEIAGRRRLRLPYLLALVALVLFSPVVTLVDEGSVAILWLGVGALAFGGVFGLLPRTAAGETIEDTFDRIGRPGMALAIVAFAVVVWTAMARWPPDQVVVHSSLVGGMVAVLVGDLIERWYGRRDSE